MGMGIKVMGSISKWKNSIYYSWKYKTRKLKLGLKKYIWVIYMLRSHPGHGNEVFNSTTVFQGAGLQR